jgi:hypothetical protein
MTRARNRKMRTLDGRAATVDSKTKTKAAREDEKKLTERKRKRKEQRERWCTAPHSPQR